MPFDNKSIKVKENKSDGSLSSPRFSISLKHLTSLNENRLTSYEILSALKGDNDVLIEANSSLFNMPLPERKSYAISFLNSVRELGLDYRYRKGVSQVSQSILAQLLRNKNTGSHEILAYVPNKVWEMEGFYRILPLYGTRYYITKEPVESGKILDDMSRMLDSEKLEYFRLIVFDSSSLGYMGINSSSMTLSDIKQVLGFAI